MRISCNNGHLGDCQWGLQLLRKAEGEHVFHCQERYHQALRELVEGTPIEIAGPNTEVEDCWIGNDRWGPTHGLFHQFVVDIIEHVRRYMDALGSHLEQPNLLPDRNSMLADWPSISKFDFAPVDVLAINANPGSGQCWGYSATEMDAMMARLVSDGHSVQAVCKTDAAPWAELTLPMIGAIARKSRLILGVATGPIWPTLSVGTEDIRRVIFLHPQQIIFKNMQIDNVANSKQAAEALNGWK